MVKKKTKDGLIGRPESIEMALDAIEKAFGKGAILFGNKESIPDVEFRSSGCLSLDKALGGGWGKGRIIEMYGPNSSGKSTLSLHAIAEAQKNGEVCAFIDVEHSFDPTYAKNLGIDLDRLAFSQPDSGEQALRIAEMLCGVAGIIVIDSVSALLPSAEIEKNIGDSTVGRQAGLMSQGMRKLSPLAAKTGTTIIFLNQIRMKIGVMFSSPETTSGGEALKFYASQRVDVRRIGGVKEGEEIVANKTRVKVVKSKLSRPFKEAEFEIRYGEGIDIAGDILELAVEKGIVTRNGTWYSIGEDKLGQGKGPVSRKIKEDPELFNSLWEQVR